LEFASITLGDLATEDGRDLVGLANGAIGVEKLLSQRIQCGALAQIEEWGERLLEEKSPALYSTSPSGRS